MGALTKTDLAIAVCREDFVNSLKQALASAGGSIPQEKVNSMTFEELRDTLAQNGIRFIYSGKTYSVSGVTDKQLLEKSMEVMNIALKAVGQTMDIVNGL